MIHKLLHWLGKPITEPAIEMPQETRQVYAEILGFIARLHQENLRRPDFLIIRQDVLKPITAYYEKEYQRMMDARPRIVRHLGYVAQKPNPFHGSVIVPRTQINTEAADVEAVYLPTNLFWKRSGGGEGDAFGIIAIEMMATPVRGNTYSLNLKSKPHVQRKQHPGDATANQ